VQIDEAPPLRRRGEPEVGEGLEECPQRGDTLDPRQRRAQARVHAGGERQVFACVGPRDVERGRISEHVRVAVGATEQQRHHVAGGDVDVAIGGARGHLHRAGEPQDLLDGAGP